MANRPWHSEKRCGMVFPLGILDRNLQFHIMPVHTRMPVILHESEYSRWLDRDATDRPPIDLLRPFPADEIKAFEVSKEVGNVRNNSADLLNSK